MESHARGAAFENRVRGLLESLQSDHPGIAKISRHPRLQLQSGEIVIPDFELEYDLGFQKDVRLVECQSRQRSSADVVHKIRHVKSLSSRNRFIFVYEDADFLDSPLRASLDADGITFYSYDEFETFIQRLSLALRGIEAASRVVTRHAEESFAIDRFAPEIDREVDWLLRFARRLGREKPSDMLRGFESFGRHERRSE